MKAIIRCPQDPAAGLPELTYECGPFEFTNDDEGRSLRTYVREQLTNCFQQIAFDDHLFIVFEDELDTTGETP